MNGVEVIRANVAATGNGDGGPGGCAIYCSASDITFNDDLVGLLAECTFPITDPSTIAINAMAVVGVSTPEGGDEGWINIDFRFNSITDSPNFIEKPYSKTTTRGVAGLTVYQTLPLPVVVTRDPNTITVAMRVLVTSEFEYDADSVTGYGFIQVIVGGSTDDDCAEYTGGG